MLSWSKTLTGLKSERKKLRDDKNDLLNQVKQLCISLQDKEKELRTFIRTFEQRIRDSESIAMKNNSDRERERWSLLKTARDEAERSLALAAQLNARDMQLQRTQEQLQEVCLIVTVKIFKNEMCSTNKQFLHNLKSFHFKSGPKTTVRIHFRSGKHCVDGANHPTAIYRNSFPISHGRTKCWIYESR